eukprot:SAG11_NODE_13160_length_667_cov_1.457746_1_plen_99_part_10
MGGASSKGQTCGSRPANDPSVRELTAMGFSVEAARAALSVSQGDVQQATELLLSEGAMSNGAAAAGGLASTFPRTVATFPRTAAVLAPASRPAPAASAA